MMDAINIRLKVCKALFLLRMIVCRMLVRPDILKDFLCGGNKTTISHRSVSALVSENGEVNLRILLLKIMSGMKLCGPELVEIRAIT